MAPQFSQWLRDTKRLAIRYILVGCAFIPPGLVYGLWATTHQPSAVAMVASLSVGFVLAAIVWRLSASKSTVFRVVISDIPADHHISAAMIAALLPPAEHWTMLIETLEGQDSRLELLLEKPSNSLFGLRAQSQKIRRQPVAGQIQIGSKKPQQAEIAQVGAAHAAFSSASS